MKELQIGEVVDEDLLKKDDDDAITAEADGGDGGAERELADASALMVVPDHDLIGRVMAAEDGKDVAPEKHLDMVDTAGEGSPENLPERVGVEDTEASGGGGGEAGVVLVEGERVKGCGCLGWGGGF